VAHESPDVRLGRAIAERGSIAPSSARVYTEYRGCTRCATADATAVYVADLSPGEICEFYRARVPQRLSVRKDSACSGNDPGSSLVLRADRSPSNNDASSEFFVLIIDQSGAT